MERRRAGGTLDMRAGCAAEHAWSQARDAALSFSFCFKKKTTMDGGEWIRSITDYFA